MTLHRARTTWALGAAVVVAVLVAGAGSAGAGISAEASPRCVVKGPKFVVYPVHGGPPSTGNTYLVQTMSSDFETLLSCAWLRAAIGRIFRANPVPWPAASRARPYGSPLKGAPKGFTCTGFSANPSGKDTNNIGGRCRGVFGGVAQLFNWNGIDPKLAG